MANSLDHSGTTTNTNNTDKQTVEFESFDWATKAKRERVTETEEPNTCSLDDGECLSCGA